MDFTNLTPLEYLAVADEVFYSALLRWVFGEHSPFALDARLRVLERITRVSYAGSTATTATTELKNIDLVVDVDHPDGARRIAFENKVKAQESPNQLANYDPLLSGATKVFLTLTGEPARSGNGWLAISYADLRSALAEEATATVSTYLNDYLAMIGRLLEAVHLVKTDPTRYAAHVFGDDPSPAPPPSFVRYVRTLRLEKVLQRIWLQAVARAAEARLSKPLDDRWIVRVEGEKQALFNVETHVYAMGTVGIQCQYGKLKFFTHPDGYPKLMPTSAQRDRLSEVLTALKPYLGACKREEPTKDNGGKGFRSFVSVEQITTREIEGAATIVASQIDRLVTAVHALETSGALTRRATAADFGA